MSDLQEQRTRAREALIGKTVAGKYLLRAVLGHGGMGAVYEAEHTELGKRFAIKFIDPEFATDDRVVARFAREARAMSAVESAHIVTVFDAGKEGDRPYLVMELLRGEDLGQRLRRTRTVPEKEAFHIVAQVLKGLARAHAAGIVHRDLKPDNVFVTKTDHDPLFAKIVDFGVSKIERPRDKTTPLALTGRGTVLGTPFYMSPEQAQCSADVDGRADVYSVGAILFECLTGRPPHTGESYEQVILSICMKDAPNLRVVAPNVSPEIAAFVARALARDKVQRFPSAERMLAALHEIAPEERTKVPLDPPRAETLLSAGVITPAAAPAAASAGDKQPISMQTRLGVGTLTDGSGLPIAVPSSPPATPIPPSPHAAAPPPPVAARQKGESALGIPGVPKKEKGKAKRPNLAPAIVTAVLATLIGVGATAGVLTALEKKKEAPTTTTHAATTSAAPPSIVSAPSAAPPPPPQVSAEPATTVAPPLATSARPNAKPVPKPPGPATTGKKLDIQRDLP